MSLIIPTRRGFLGLVLATATAPAILRQGIIMPTRRVHVSSGAFYADLAMRGNAVMGTVLMDHTGQPLATIPFMGGERWLVNGDNLYVTVTRANRKWTSRWDAHQAGSKPVQVTPWQETIPVEHPARGHRPRLVVS